MPCEICGKDEQLVKAMIEDIELEVCRNCGNFGTVKTRPTQTATQVPRTSPREFEQEESVVDDFAARMKQARETKGLTQTELAKKLNEKVSVISAIEAGRQPDIALAQKIGHMLHVTLVEKPQEAALARTGKGTATTIGDIVKMR